MRSERETSEHLVAAVPFVRQALIPAAGRGLRLDRPNTPKPLVDIGGQALIVRLLSQLRKAGIEKAVVTLGYEAERILRRLVHRFEPDMTVDVVLVSDWEKGQAHSLLCGLQRMSGPFLLAMADHVFSPDLIPALLHHSLEDGDILAFVDPRVESIFDLAESVKVLTQDATMVEIDRQLTRYNAIDTGLFLATAAVEDALRYAVDLFPEAELTDALRFMVRHNEVRTVPLPPRSFWHDVDTPADVVRAEMTLRQHKRIGHLTTDCRVAHESIAVTPFHFSTGKPVETAVQVGRGMVKNPQKFHFIPESSASSPIYIFTDEKVHALHGREFSQKLTNQGYDIREVVLPEGEGSKSLSTYEMVVAEILARGVDEQSLFISLGGGVINNICGFVASTIYRGLPLIHFPTTLMAQCDAAISHKQAINGPNGKNLIGSYYAPVLVAVDIETLTTLDDRLIIEGLAEVLKHALGQDVGYYDELMDYVGSIRHLDFLEYVVKKNIELKAELMATDPQELQAGMVLQYGHTVGHPVEHLSGYRLYHGEAIAIGMMVAAQVSFLMAGADDTLLGRHERLLNRYGLPTRIPHEIKTDDILDSLRFNKRFLVEGTRMALVKEVGSIWSVDDECAIPVSEPVLIEAIERSKERSKCPHQQPSSLVLEAV